ncbi:MAG: M48 family metalloprotease [Pirellulaceae bacterium]
MPARQLWLPALWGSLLLACLLLAGVVSAQDRPPRFEPGKFPGFPDFGGPKFGGPGKEGNFDPQRMFEQLFGQGGETDFADEELAKVEISLREEAELGRQGLDEVRRTLAARKVKLLERGSEVEYLSRLVELVRPHMTQAARYPKLRVYLMETGEAEAYAYPGGHLYFSRGLLDAAQCEAALVSVVGHELAHLDRGHLLRRAKQWKLAQQSLANPREGFSPDKMFQTLGMMQRLFQRPFGPDEELEADTDGIRWAYALGYDPRSVELVYVALGRRGEKGGADFMPAFLRTHPQSAERTANLRKTFNELTAADPTKELYLGRQNLARRLTRRQREFLD